MGTMTSLGYTAHAAIALTAIALLACGTEVVGAGGGGTTSATTGSATTSSTASTTGTTTTASVPYDACSTPADCAWGEISHEILTPADCPCLYGCPYLPLGAATVARRKAQYQMFCTPGVDGKGNGCGIDDCAVPEKIDCQAGHCGAAATP